MSAVHREPDILLTLRLTEVSPSSLPLMCCSAMYSSGTQSSPTQAGADSSNSRFLVWFIVVAVVVIGCYLVYHNKTKVSS